MKPFVLAIVLFVTGLVGCGGLAATAGAPELGSIEITPGTGMIAATETLQLTATGSYDNNTTKDLSSGGVTWTSADPTIATVDANGLVTGVFEGSARISAQVDNISASITVDVSSGGLAKISISASTATMPLGTQQQFTAHANAQDGSDLGAITATWISSDPAIIDIQPDGTATALALGTADITATSMGVTSPAVSTTVGAAALTSLAITPAMPRVGIGFTAQLTADGTYTDQTKVDPATVTWSIDHMNIATISATGVVTPVAVGTATVTAMVGTTTATTTLTVTAATLVSLAITPDPASVVPGGTTQLTATGTFSDSSTLDMTQTSAWTSDQPGTATVSATGTRGVVTGVAVGTATIHVTNGTVTDMSTVNVLGLAVSSTTPADGLVGVRTTAPITIAFNQAIDATSITAQTTTGACSGTVQISATNFSTCVAVSNLVAAQATTLTAAMQPLATYKIRVTTGAKNAGGVAMTAQFTSAGFTTATDGSCASTIIISQVYGGGGNSGAPYNADFVELHNAGAAPESVKGFSIQYASSTGTTWSMVKLPDNVTIPAGGYYLVQMSPALATGAALNADLVAQPAVLMSASAGKVGLFATQTLQVSSCPLADSLDFIGYGTGTNCFEGSASAPIPSNTKSDQRSCTDQNDNSTDFTAAAPVPHNAMSAASVCACTANETDKVSEMDYCNLQSPLTLSLATNATATVYGQTYEQGITEAAGADARITMQLGIGPANMTNASPLVDTYAWQATTYNVQVGNNDEYQATLTAPATAATYLYTTRASRDGVNWTYCDSDGAGSNLGLVFDATKQGTLTVH
ncbi:MAG: Ig-like domain-containing protein [Kofleriaceae bacterium]